jgi:hypothetical protein
VLLVDERPPGHVDRGRERRPLLHRRDRCHPNRSQ